MIRWDFIANQELVACEHNVSFHNNNKREKKNLENIIQNKEHVQK